MAVARVAGRRPPKRARVAKHVDALRRDILGRYPDARFMLGRIPESSWPALFVSCAAQYVSDVTNPLLAMMDDFFVAENMDVHVIVMAPGELD
jgi:hypothetical protein